MKGYTLKKIKKYSSTVILVLYASISFGQKPILRFTSINHKNGLSSNKITAVLQDSEGMIWTGNKIAIDRYDGYRTHSYTLGRNNNINKIVEDKDKNIWATTTKGLYCFNKKEGGFKKITSSNFQHKQFLDQNIVALKFMTDNIIYISTDSGNFFQYKYDDSLNPIEDSFKGILNRPAPLKFHITKIIDGPEESLILGTSYGEVFKMKDGTISHYFLKNSENIYRINDLSMDEHNNLWVATDGNGLFKIDLIKNKTKHFIKNKSSNLSINNNVVLCLLSDNNRVWMGTDGGGLNLYYHDSETFEYYTQDFYSTTNIADNSILDIKKGHNNTILLSTVHGGLSIVKNNFDIKNIPALKLGFSTKDQQGSNILEDSNKKIWISAGREGLVKYDPDSGSSTLFTDNPSLVSDLNGSIVMSMVEDHNKRLWVGTLRGGISIIDLNSDEFLNLKPENQVHQAYALALDHSGNIWVGNRTGITIYNENLDIKEKFTPTEPLYNSSNLVNVIFKDIKNDMWVGTANGLFRYELINKGQYKKHSYYHDNTDSTTINGNHILSVGQNSNLNIFIGTYGYGVNQFNRKQNNFSPYTLSDQMAGKTIEGIICDKNKNTWFSTNLGLTKVDSLQNVFNFNHNDAVYPFNGGGAYIGTNGLIYMAGSFGLSYFNPALIDNSESEFKINFIAAKAISQNTETSYSFNELTQCNNNFDSNITIPPNNNLFTITYSCSDPIISNDLKYEYKIAELNNTWNNVGSQQTITFSNMNPGTYSLWVKAIDKNGTPVKAHASLKITVLPAIHQTIWFKVLMILLAIVLLLIIYFWRISFLRKKEIHLKNLLDQKTNEAKRQEQRIAQDKIRMLQIEKDHQELSQKQLIAELKFKNQELTNNTLLTVHKNDLLNNIKDKLQFEVKQKQIDKKNILLLIDHINDSFMLDKEWEQFYALFKEVHPFFLDNLKSKHSNLSERDIKLCALILMKFTSQNIANLFGISLSSIKVARHRLRRKLNLENDQDLYTFLKKYN